MKCPLCGHEGGHSRQCQVPVKRNQSEYLKGEEIRRKKYLEKLKDPKYKLVSLTKNQVVIKDGVD